MIWKFKSVKPKLKQKDNQNAAVGCNRNAGWHAPGAWWVTPRMA